MTICFWRCKRLQLMHDFRDAIFQDIFGCFVYFSRFGLEFNYQIPNETSDISWLQCGLCMCHVRPRMRFSTEFFTRAVGTASNRCFSIVILRVEPKSFLIKSCKRFSLWNIIWHFWLVWQFKVIEFSCIFL